MKSSRFLSMVIPLLFVHPAFALEGPPPQGAPGGQRPGPPPGAPPGGQMGGPQLTADQEIKEYLTLDKNGDGNLSKDEITARFQSLITRADSNGDGVVSSEELVHMISLRFAAKAKRGAERGGPGGPPPGGMPDGRRDDAKPGTP